MGYPISGGGGVDCLYSGFGVGRINSGGFLGSSTLQWDNVRRGLLGRERAPCEG